jgi:hypothetical protein
MKQQRAAATTFAALLTLAACAENPVAPPSDAGYTAILQSSARASDRHYTFTRFDVDAPFTFQTVPSGINADGVIVGWYFSGTGCPAAPCAVKGFIFKDGAFTTVVYHNAAGTNAVNTQLRGIGPSGEIVGNYRMAGEPGVNFHGFILTTAGEFVSVDYPGHTSTIPQRILPNGTILGCYHDTDQMLTMHGIWKGKGGFSALDRATTMNNGGTPNARTVTGLYTDMVGTAAEKGRGYVIDDGVFTGFDAPGSDFTTAWDMNPAGTIVGWFEEDGTANIHGYVLEHWRVSGGELSGTYTTIDFPLTATTNAAYTDVFGINPAGDIVGKFREAAGGPFHGYIATRKTE